MKQEIINGNVHTYDDAGRLITVRTASLMPPILQLQSDPFPTESDALAEKGFIEQDASAPIKEQASWVLAENDSLKEKLALAIAQLKEVKQQNAELTRKAKLYDGYFGLLAQCLHDVKV